MSGATRRELLAGSMLLPAALRAPRWALQDPAPADGPSPSARVARFERLAFGLFLHYGLYSQVGAGEWAMNSQGIPRDR